MKSTRTSRRRAAAINSVKVLLTSASLAATLGGWVVISAANRSTVAVAQVSANATVQTVADASQIAPLSTAATAAGITQTSAVSAAGTSVPATAVPTQVVVQTRITTHSS